MTLRTMLQQVAEECGYDAPGTFVGNSNLVAKKLLRCANTEGRVLARGRTPDGLSTHDWTALVKEQTFTTNGSGSYAMTSAGIITDNDFERFVTQTWWDRTSQRPLILYNPPKWQWLQSSISTNTSIDRTIRLRGGNLLLDPDDSGQTLAFEYLSKHWCESAGGTGQTAWAADTDVGVLPEDLMGMGIKWRFLQLEGLPYADQREEYEQEVALAMAHDGGMEILRQEVDVVPNGRVPDTGFGV